jgi:anti-sigma regulatory factor (Ser/Thr protein kinase)
MRHPRRRDEVDVNHDHQRVAVTERSQVAEARAVARRVAGEAGLPDEAADRLGLVVTELGTNLVKHTAEGGELLMRPMGAPAAVECLAIDAGAGITDIPRCLTDGHSTAGSPGTGLGAVRRLAATFDIHSSPGRGTVIRALVADARTRPPRPACLLAGGVSVAKAGEPVCGDAWAISGSSDRVAVILADGLGHGLAAHEAAEVAVSQFARRADASCAATLERLHHEMRHTRGAAVGTAVLDRTADHVAFAGAGNVSAHVVRPGGRQQIASTYGTLGHEVHQFREQHCRWDRGSLLVLHSDGLQSRWALEAYPGLSGRHPSVIAAVLYRDFSRRTDDVTVVVVKEAA